MLQDNFKKCAIKHYMCTKINRKGVMLYVQSLQDVIRTKQKDFNYNITFMNKGLDRENTIYYYY